MGLVMKDLHWPIFFVVFTLSEDDSGAKQQS